MHCKKDRKHILKTVLCYIVVLWTTLSIISSVVSMVHNPMRRPRAMVESHISRITPMGTHIDEVIEIIRMHDDWHIAFINYERGFTRPQQGGSSIEEGQTVVGDMSVRVNAGPYWPTNVPLIRFITESMTSVFWGFNEDGVLIEVYVQKSLR